MSSSAPSVLARLGSLAVLLLAVSAAPLTACSTDGSDDDDSTECNGTACGTNEFCLFRECSAAESCTPSTDTSCPSGTTPASCSDGEPGCSVDSCTVVQGCRTIPSGCSSSDLACACASVCGSVAACASVSGTTVVCASS